MDRLRNMLKDRRGFSLLEMMVAMAILALLSVVVANIMITSQNMANADMAQGEVQKELNDTQDFIHNEVLTANVGLVYMENNGHGWAVADSTSETATQSALIVWIRDTQNETVKRECFLYDKAEHEMRYTSDDTALEFVDVMGQNYKVSRNGGVTLDDTVNAVDSYLNGTDSKAMLLSNRVTAFNVTVPEYDSGNGIIVSGAVAKIAYTVEKDDASVNNEDVISFRNSRVFVNTFWNADDVTQK